LIYFFLNEKGWGVARTSTGYGWTVKNHAGQAWEWAEWVVHLANERVE
jgi:hypothetical protein